MGRGVLGNVGSALAMPAVRPMTAIVNPAARTALAANLFMAFSFLCRSPGWAALQVGPVG